MKAACDDQFERLAGERQVGGRRDPQQRAKVREIQRPIDVIACEHLQRDQVTCCQVSHEGFGFRIVRECYREIGIFREPWLRPGRNSQPADERERDAGFVQLPD